MFDYFRTAQGRTVALAMALPLIVGATVPFSGDGVGYYAVAIIAAIALTFFALGLSLESHPNAALTGILALPVALFLYGPLVGIVAPRVHFVVYLMAAAACFFLAIAARPGLLKTAKTEAHVPRTV